MVDKDMLAQQQRIEYLLKSVKSVTGGNLELESHWARYICVLVSGFVENAFKAIFSNYIRNRSNKAIAAFACERLHQVRNPKICKFVEFAGSFNPQWKDDLEQFLGSKIDGHAVDSIMNNRHNIAHGRDSDITMLKVTDYFSETIKFLEYVESKCNN